MKCKCNEKCNDKYENEKEEREENENIEMILYIISIFTFILTFIPFFNNVKLILYIITIILAGYEILIDGIKNIFKFNFKEDTLMTIAVIAACILGEFVEATLVILLFKLGETIEERAVDQSNKSIADIVDIKSNKANLLENNEIKVVEVEEINVNDNILIKPGERVPVDCQVIYGSSNLDTSSITGESMPILAAKGQKILSGYINLNGSLTCKVIKDYKNSTISQIIDLVYEAQNNKGKTEKFITRFSKVYTPIVLILAILITLVPTILGNDFKTWIMRSLVFLVASCPCSIVISIPLALYTAIGAISKKGMLIKGTKHIENLAKTTIMAFDKTGTITTGKMKIKEIELYENITEKAVLEYSYSIERNSSHPIASAIENRIDELNLKNEINVKNVIDYEEIPGCGICGKIEEKTILFGNKKLLEKYLVNDIKKEQLDDNRNYLVVDNKIIASISLEEEVRKGTKQLIEELYNLGIKKIVMLTGDNEKNANKIAKEIGIKEVYSSLLPNQKLEKLVRLKEKNVVTFIGDGINDSPVLAAADFSISIGEGTEIASNTADSILISNNLNSISKIIKLARKAMRVLNFNIIFSLLVKMIVLILGILGFAPIWLAVFADVGVTLITILNAIRIK